ncbi:putative membrane protein [Pedobacter cryoconitis]|uniref:Putative membrane protein n=1 Tax=Pedobacter cryoconitis TaxID=188932 RepID=A0A7W8ZR60_9SPHI|nr:bestrophin family ion channel [Pedobacter cryoconitis]MBB5638667.1 putative membrane protein [Pedobacter cryoconitis]
MIIRKKENWLRMLFIWRGSVLPQILFRLMLLLLISVVIVYCRGSVFNYKIQLNPGPFTLFGIALAIFFGFRNNVSYDRFWEGRKIWGSLLNTTRSLTRQAQTVTAEKDNKGVNEFVNLLISFTYALKHQLRHTDATADIARISGTSLADKLKPAIYKPAMLLTEMGAWVRRRRLNGELDSILATSFDQNLNEMSNIVGGCERIASTPIPYTYKVLLHRTVYIYCFLLPFGFVDSLGWMMPVIVVFIAYTFVALEAVADELEDPFGEEPNDLALNTLCAMIETTLLEMSDREVPAPLAAKGYILD